MAGGTPNLIVVLGATATGKTALGARLAHALGGEVISVDSRQVYRGLDIGSGKDLDEYVVEGVRVPYHLIDIADLHGEFSVFDFQRTFYAAFQDIQARGKLPIAVGGTGLYLEAALKGYSLVFAPEDPVLRAELALLDDAALAARLAALRPRQHNTTDTCERERMVRAIEIAMHDGEATPEAPEICPLLLGIRWPREVLRRRIAARLCARLDAGLIAEVRDLHAAGHTWERLNRLGLEYREVGALLRGEIADRAALEQRLGTAIGQFAKRQETWFRRMERNGAQIHWLARPDLAEALRVVREAGT